MIEMWMAVQLVSNDNCNIVNLYCPIFCLHGMRNNVSFTFSVGDTTRAVYNQYGGRHLNL